MNTERPRGLKGLTCPLLKKDMSQVCHKCPWWTSMSTIDPVTNKPLEDWACAISWMPKMMFENAKQTNAAGAAIETFRNEMSKVGGNLTQIANARTQS